MKFPLVGFSLVLFISLSFASTVFSYGSLGPIAAAFGDNGFFCAIDAGGNQEIVCWDKNNKSSSHASTTSFSSLPTMASLSGGEGFMCGITSSDSHPYCWSLSSSGNDLVPEAFRYTSYSKIAAGKNHVCAVKGMYYSGNGYGTVDCWEFTEKMNGDVVYDSKFSDAYIGSLEIKEIVSGDGFSCGVVKDEGVVCWGPKSAHLSASVGSGDYDALASSRGSVCGISSISDETECWGVANETGVPPLGVRFVGLSAGAYHFCGVRGDDHGVQCWGSINASSVPKASGFMAIASADLTNCGVREVDFVLDCWGVHDLSPRDYSPPLQLCSPGLCSPGRCESGKFAFNASILGETGLTSLCAKNDLNLCLPCGSKCSEGYFPSSVCSENADRVCTPCSLCQSSSCRNVCQLPSQSVAQVQEGRKLKKYILITGSCVIGSLLVFFLCCMFSRIIKPKDEGRGKVKCISCVGKPIERVDSNPNIETQLSTITVEETRVFRLSELKDATHGFKEFYELGRGSFGFVYKAVLSDGKHVAVKRANAATIIHTTNRDFEAELEILCNARHGNIVNLLGYCAEMGERLLVYEFMPHGTLSDHLHGELSPLDWNLRLKISLQAAKGLEYLHKEVTPPIIHTNLKTSNILLDSEWGARIADFGLISATDRETDGDIETDVYDFGIVLLEILSGRKAIDRDFTPPEIVYWAVPLIRQGKAAAVIDRNVSLPRNVEPLLKLADVAELALREDSSQRPSISDLASLLDQIVKSGLTF